MKALWCNEPGKMVFEDRPDPFPGPGRVRLKVLATAVCGSDKKTFIKGQRFGGGKRISGHEFVGIVDLAGEGTDAANLGKRMCAYPVPYCNDCEECRAGYVNLCRNRSYIGGRDYDGGFAEYVIVPENMLLEVPDRVTDLEAAMTEPFAVALHAVNQAGGRSLKGKTLVIYGTGPVGFFALEAAKVCEVDRVIVVGRTECKLRLAMLHGAYATINTCGKSAEELRSELFRINGGTGADAVIDAIGMESSLNEALLLCRPHGRVAVVGMMNDRFPVDMGIVIRNELSVTGSYTYVTEMLESLQLMGSGNVSIGYIANPVAPLSEGPAVFKKLIEKPNECIKAVFIP